jgi:hypothetical protein
MYNKGLDFHSTLFGSFSFGSHSMSEGNGVKCLLKVTILDIRKLLNQVLILSVAYNVVTSYDHFGSVFQLAIRPYSIAELWLLVFLPLLLSGFFPSTISCRKATRIGVPLISTTYDERWIHLLSLKSFILFFLVIL